MEKRFIEDDILEGVDKKRRDFIKKVVIGTAFAVPVINSFSMDGLKVRMGAGQAEADSKEGSDASSTGVVAVPVDKRPPPASPLR
ncbi:MAG: hypothetical protein R6X27_11110 [Candidatus Desulfacyla sp.]